MARIHFMKLINGGNKIDTVFLISTNGNAWFLGDEIINLGQ